MLKLAWLFAAGGVGTLARFGVSSAVQRVFGGEWPLGTIVVNLFGCLIFGFIATFSVERSVITPETRLIILTGFLGAFTTFSTFAHESAAALRDSQWIKFSANLAIQNVVGIAAVFAGAAFARTAA